jgi:hypothetical protein
MFPVEAVSSHLAQLVSDSYDRITEQSGWWGVSRKYYSVEQEHHLEMISLLIGSAFVLGQAALTQTVAIAIRLWSIAGEPTWLPASKAEVLRVEPTIHTGTRMSEMVLIDEVANYFKHHYEWPTDWDTKKARRTQRRTIQRVASLGLAPGNHENNLQAALQGLGLCTSTMSSLASKIQGWRERLADRLRSGLHEHGFE